MWKFYCKIVTTLVCILYLWHLHYDHVNTNIFKVGIHVFIFLAPHKLEVPPINDWNIEKFHQDWNESLFKIIHMTLVLFQTVQYYLWVLSFDHLSVQLHGKYLVSTISNKVVTFDVNFSCSTTGKSSNYFLKNVITSEHFWGFGSKILNVHDINS